MSSVVGRCQPSHSVQALVQPAWSLGRIGRQNAGTCQVGHLNAANAATI